MKKNVKKKLVSTMIFLSPAAMMAAEFKTAISKVMGIGGILAFCLCVFFIFEGIIHWRQGGSFGKDIIGVVITASAFAICALIFAAFGISDAAVTPQF